jgi:hypothetical protein
MLHRTGPNGDAVGDKAAGGVALHGRRSERRTVMAMCKTECVPGRRVVWLQVPRGGYFSLDRSYPVDAVVTGVGLARVRIRVQKRTGESVERWVSPERLLPVEGESFAHAVATSRELTPEDRDFWLRVCEAEGT